MKRLAFAAALLCIAASATAQADTVNVSAVTGVWTDIDPNGLPSATGLGSNEIRWGIPTGAPTDKSGYRFDGNAPQSFNVGDGATLGTFTHYNFPINSGTSITGATLDLDITFTSDLFVGTKIFHSQFIFAHNETPNTGGGCCDDIVSVLFNPAHTDFFSFGGHDYSFGVTGFQRNNVDAVSFSSAEGGMNTALLRGSFADVTTFNAVPGPIAGAGIPGLVGLFGLVALQRRRRMRFAS